MLQFNLLNIINSNTDNAVCDLKKKLKLRMMIVIIIVIKILVKYLNLKKF
jgi:hypothetical protein